jgi:1-aminocyclopropane-1-carboxylate deaminase/D-cysteine desulfhydrase-like pyridoxal-dependent ACC family enzyme
MTSVFPKLGLKRSITKWEHHLGTLTPWELRQGIWFKREDYFAPLGYGGPNGSKLRQLIWFMNKYKKGKTHVLTGASVQSPQLSMSAIVGAHYGLKSRQVVYSKPSTVLRHENPRIAAGFGAHFEYATGPYNPIIQRKVADLTLDTSLVVEYGITLPHDVYDRQEVLGFHKIGARQTDNLPARIDRLIVPAGSCNTLCSIILGLHNRIKRGLDTLQQLFTIGIGPDKTEWIKDRLAIMGVDTWELPFSWRHVSLHDSGYSTYSQKFQGEEFDGISFHPTYEAKMWRWLWEHEPIDQNCKTGFWIVGSAPNAEVIRPYFTAEKLIGSIK